MPSLRSTVLLCSISLLLNGVFASSAVSQCTSSVDDVLRPATFRIRYLPSSERVHALVVIPTVSTSSMPGLLRFEPRPHGRRDVLASAEKTPAQLAREPETTLPATNLRPGTYEVALIAPSHGGCPDAPERARTFNHDNFEWEGNSIGILDDVIPPFTPVEVEGASVRTVLRRHQISETGLWAQVESLDRALLASPMRWEIRSDGRDQPIRATQPILVRSATKARATIQGEWSAGPLRARSSAEIEMDGFMSVKVAFDSDVPVRVEKLDLIIPLRADAATLMNAITDGTLHHTLGELPKGEGRIWDSTKTRHVELPNEFTPYIWVGNEERGLSWLAESMRGAWVSRGLPNQEIRRRDGIVEIVIHFATRTGRLDRPREIEFALQATPVKPRRLGAVDWRRWQLSCTAEEPFFRLCPLPAGYYWGAESPYGHVGPRGDDPSVLAEIARVRRGGAIDPGFVGRWMTRHRVDPTQLQAVRGGINHTLGMANLKPDAMIAYVNPHDSSWTREFAVYTDEWRRIPYSERDGRDGSSIVEIDTTPSRSFQDYMLWNLAKLLDSRAIDGFFFDNTFPAAVFDPRSDRSWIDDDGTVQAAADWRRMRELLKRAQILTYQKRGAWLNVGHMTSTPIAAVQGWTGISLSGEWKDGSVPFQERFSRDLLRAESMGSQAGTVPVVLPGIQGTLDPSKMRALERSLAGVAALHEIRVMQRFDGEYAALWKSLARAGYGSDNCRVRTYWMPNVGDIESPASEVTSLVVDCRERSTYLLVNYGTRTYVELGAPPEPGVAGTSVACRDVESASPRRIPSTGRTCRISVERNDYRLIEVVRSGAAR